MTLTVDDSHPPVAKNVLLIDFDGTIAPWDKPMFGFNAPLDGAPEFIRMMKDKGFTIGIFTSRLSPHWLVAENENENKHREYIHMYCDRFNIPYDFMTSEKRPAFQYFDDRATNVRNNWRDLINQWRSVDAK